MALQRLDEAIDCCVRCLDYDPDNKGVQAVLDKGRKAQEAKEKQEQERLERIRKEEQLKRKLRNAYKVQANLYIILTVLNLQLVLLGKESYRYSQSRRLCQSVRTSL